MNEMNFEKVRILVGEPDSRISQGIKHSLQSQGFREIQITGAFRDVERAVELNQVDLLLSEIDFDDGDICELTRKIRHQEIGDNPFLFVVAVADSSAEEIVNDILDSGFDDLIVKPLSTASLSKRFSRFAKSRKPFVVTKDYVGPDRRTSERQWGQRIPLIEVPNPIKARMGNELGSKAFQKSIEETAKVLKAEQVKRLAYQINWLIERIMPSCLDDKICGETYVHLTEVCDSAERVLKVVEETAFAAEEVIFRVACDVAANIRRVSRTPKQTEFDKLFQVSKLINDKILLDRTAA